MPVFPPLFVAPAVVLVVLLVWSILRRGTTGEQSQPMAGMARAAEFVPFTPICNMTGQPAMSVPLFWNEEGLPVGSHFIGRFGDEATLFRLAAQLEAARPWANRRPPVSAI